MKKRVLGIDVIKGISIFLVVFYHTITSNYIKPEAFFDYLGAFLLNAFFFAAGWVYAYSSKTNYNRIAVTKKIVVLGIPYIVLSLLAIIYQCIIGTVLGINFISDVYQGKELLLRNIYCAVSLTGIGTLWFLPVILIANLFLMLCINKAYAKKKALVILGVVCFIAFAVYILFVDRIEINIVNTATKILSEEIRFVNRIVVGCAYILLGYLTNKLLSKLDKGNGVNVIIGIVCLIVGVILYNLNVEVYKIFYTLSECLIVIFLCEFKWIGILTKPISYLGRNSLYIMVVHYIFVQPVVMKAIWGSYYMMNTSVLQKREVLFVVEWIVTIGIIEIGKRFDDFLFLFGKGERFEKLTRRILRRSKYHG